MEESLEEESIENHRRSYEMLQLPPPETYRIAGTLEASCDDNPRIFHMFWAGPFTDKPYMALLSWLYTQDTGIHLHQGAFESTVCRPVMWIWINPGPAAAVPNPAAESDMYDELRNSPWSQPFLHPRFADVIKFKLWNTTEQLDGIPELKDQWRSMQEYLFSSEGVVFDVKNKNASPDNMANRTGSKSASKKDKLSTVLSDMVRFVACHRYGGIYIDADTIFLRDWHELWGWRGAFAYRWSRLNRYNTAVLRMNKGSALGSWLFRTALHNKLDFHPITVGRYLRDAHMEHLLLRLPSALFDSAWLTAEHLELDRPPQPLFQE
jgi:DDB1- and CUL4-associated factor 13